MTEFDYIIEKIKDASFSTTPFKHIYIEDFLTEEHLNLILECPEVKTENYPSTEKMLSVLKQIGYVPVAFPGCTINPDEYLRWYNSGLGDMPGHTHGLTEGFGMAMRLEKPKNNNVQELIAFLNSDKFVDTLLEKFGMTEEVYVETAIQKYLTGYEISPHPDVRKKCLTYLLNTNDVSLELEDVHTRLMEFKPRYEHVKERWEINTAKDRCWVPWSWAETQFKQDKNNSICIFAPASDTLHSVKLDYDHCKSQRTNIYGNLWFVSKTHRRAPTTWREI